MNTFPFNIEKNSICTICKAADCDNFTLWLRKGGKSSKRFYLKDLSEIEPNTGNNNRLPGGSKSDYKGLYGRIGDLLNFVKSSEVVDIDTLRKEAFRYILGVDSCQGFNRFGKVNNNQISSGPHSLQNKVISMGLFDEAVKDTRVLSSPDKKVKTSKWGKKSYINGQ